MEPNYVAKVYKISVLWYCMQIQVSSLMAIRLETSDRYPAVNTPITQSHLVCPERGPAPGTPTFRGSGQVGVDSIRPQGAPGQGPEGP